jgi:hypothetical protein
MFSRLISALRSFARPTHPRASGAGWRIALSVFVVLALSALILWPVPLLYDANTPGHAGWLRDLAHIMGKDDFAFNVAGMMIVTGLLHGLIYGAVRAPWRYRWQIATALAALVIVLECAQLFLPHRHFDPADIVAGMLGVPLLTLPWTRAAWR